MSTEIEALQKKLERESDALIQLSFELNLNIFKNQIVRLSLRIQFADLQLHRYGKGDLIFLLGTSTSGKTTFAETLQHLEPYRFNCGIDSSINEELRKKIKNFWPQHYHALSRVTYKKKITNIIFCGDRINFKPNVSAELKDAAENARIALEKAINELQKNSDNSKKFFHFGHFYDKVLERMIHYSRRGIPVVHDVVDFRCIQHFFSKNFHAPVRIVFVFCPLRELSNRMAKRNKLASEQGEFSESRVGFPLFQFSRLYGPKQHATTPTFEMIRRKEAEEIFDVNFPLENNEKENKESKEVFLNSLGFVSPEIDRVEITPRFRHYDTFINTEIADPRAAAELLLGHRHRTPVTNMQRLELLSRVFLPIFKNSVTCQNLIKLIESYEFNTSQEYKP
jgi:hypothetical protein